MTGIRGCAGALNKAPVFVPLFPWPSFAKKKIVLWQILIHTAEE